MRKNNKKNLPHPPDNAKEMAWLASFTDFNPRPIVETDTKGNITYLNQAAKAEIPDLPEKGIRHKYLSEFKKVSKVLKTQKNIIREVKIGDQWFRQALYYVKEFQVIRIYGSNVTEQKENALAWEKNNLRYRSLFNKMSEGYAICELLLDKKGRPHDYRLLELNPAFENITGIKRRHLIGKTYRQTLRGKEAQRLNIFSKVVMSGKPAQFEEYRKELGRYYEVFVHKIDAAQFGVFFLDITNLKRVEKEKDNFISIMSHELRNPLTPILAGAQLLAKSTAIAKQPELAQVAQAIERQAKNMATLLNDILDTSRMSRRKIQLDKKVVNISELVVQALETCRPHIEGKMQAASLSLPRTPVYLTADPVRLEQIVVNLINNASKYTKPRGNIKVSAKKHNAFVEISVKDNGQGIGKEKMKKIFRLFTTTDESPLGPMGSLGIGLNISKHLVVMHGGKITVKSKGENKGSEFLVRLPGIIQGRKTSERVTTAGVKSSKKPARILIVDDQKDIAHLLSKLLHQEGHTIKVAYDGPKALALAQSFRPKVALVDIGLPGMSGYEVAHHLKSHREMTLVAVTGYGQEKDVRKALAAGFHYHLRKPVDMESLRTIIGR